MVIELKPETEELLKQELSKGRPIDDIIVHGIYRGQRTNADQPFLTPEQRAASYRDWYENLPRNEVVLLDDSRETIYEEHP